MSDPMTPDELGKAINDSGFPLQLGLTSLTRGRDWSVCLTEHPWCDPLGEAEKFIDLILRGRGAAGPQRLVIECKRAKDADWIFLRSQSSYSINDNRSRLRARIVSQYAGVKAHLDEWADIQFRPTSPEATFCVIRKNGQRSQELLEKTAAEVARAADALARQELRIHDGSSASLTKGLARLYVPIIVTTASMYVCDADYSTVDLKTGEVTGATSLPAPIVRFRKSLGLDNPQMTSSIEEFAGQSERSVLVVRADSFADFLRTADISMSTDEMLKEALFNVR